MDEKNKIKLFVDAHVFDGIHQGTVTYISGLYKEIVKNTDIQLFVGSEDYDLAVKFIDSKNFVHIQYKSHSKFRRLAIDIPMALWKYKIDYAHFQYIAPPVKVTKYIVTIHDLLFLDFPQDFPLLYRIKNKWLFYLSSKRADILTTVSEYSKNSIYKHFKIPKSKIFITPNAVNQEVTSPYPVDSLLKKQFILYVSRIEPRKNQALLIELWKELELCNSDIDLVIVGSEGLRDDKFWMEKENLTDKEKTHFWWLTKVPHSNLTWLYQNCLLFVFPSSAEGFGIPPLEAAYLGAKVICSNTTAMADFDFFHGFQFNPENKKELKKLIVESLKNNFPHNEIISAINDRYNWVKIAIDFANFVQQDYISKIQIMKHSWPN